MRQLCSERNTLLYKKITILKIETKSLDCEQKGSYYVHSSLFLPNDRFVSEKLTIIIRKRP